MTVQEAYKRFLLKINKNDTNNEVNISFPEFIVTYNEQSLIWLREKLVDKNSTDSINDIYELLVEDYKLSNFSENKKHNDFLLPDDFYKVSSLYAEAERNGCEKDIDVYIIKPKEKNTWLSDDLNSPSFEWEETIGIISNNTIQVYKSDFDVISLYLSYYKKPVKIDVEGYTHIDGSISKTIHPDLSDVNVNEIINRCALEIVTDYQNGEAFQLQQNKILKEK